MAVAVTVGPPNTSPGAIGAVVRAGIIPSRFYEKNCVKYCKIHLTGLNQAGVKCLEIVQSY